METGIGKVVGPVLSVGKEHQDLISTPRSWTVILSRSWPQRPSGAALTVTRTNHAVQGAG